jgi:hypothetical protein
MSADGGHAVLRRSGPRHCRDRAGVQCDHRADCSSDTPILAVLTTHGRGVCSEAHFVFRALVLAAQKSPMESQVSVVTYASRASLPRILPYSHPAGAVGWCGLLLPDVMQPILWWLREHKEKANDVDNSHTCGNLHRARNQRLPAGRVLILGSDLVRAARSPAARSLSCPHHRPAHRGRC